MTHPADLPPVVCGRFDAAVADHATTVSAGDCVGARGGFPRRVNAMRRLAFGALLLLFAQAAAEQGASGPSPTPPPARSGVELAPIFAREVRPRLNLPEEERAAYAGLLGVALTKANVVQTTAQYVLLVDRSPKVHSHQRSVAGVLPLEG